MVGPTDIVIQPDNNKSLMYNSKLNLSCSIMSTTIDSNSEEVTLSSSQTKSTNHLINSNPLSSISENNENISDNNNNDNINNENDNNSNNGLSNSIDSLYSPEILSKLSLSSSSPSFSPSFSLSFSSDFNVYYPPPLNIAGDDDFYSNNNNTSSSISGFISNKRKSPYLYKSEKNPSRCLSCNRVILKYIVGVNSNNNKNINSNNTTKFYPKSTGYKCNQCNTAICEKCASESTSKISSTSSFGFVSTCDNCMKKGNKKTSVIVKY